MAKKALTVELSEELYTRFIETVTEEGGHWRGKETPTDAIESATMVALMLFLQYLDEETKPPDTDI
jgi:hypothetical protein